MNNSYAFPSDHIDVVSLASAGQPVSFGDHWREIQLHAFTLEVSLRPFRGNEMNTCSQGPIGMLDRKIPAQEASRL